MDDQQHRDATATPGARVLRVRCLLCRGPLKRYEDRTAGVTRAGQRCPACRVVFMELDTFTRRAPARPNTEGHNG